MKGQGDVKFSYSLPSDHGNSVFRKYIICRIRAMRTLKSYVVNIEERIAAAERFLVKNILKGRDNPCIKNAVAELLSKKGNVGITELTENVPVGARQLQRLFQKYIGVSP